MDDAKEALAARCGWCAHGTPADDGAVVICPRKGVMEPDGACPRFCYDPLRRQPTPPAILPEMKEEDFRL